jgi:hypothetical protein
MADLRRKAKTWIPGRVRIVRGHVPKDVSDWRDSVSLCLRRRVDKGLDTKFEAILIHVWDTAFTGDGRKQDCIEHYHTSNCSGDDAECIDRCADAVDDVLSKIPKLFSRRSWHGHIQTTNHIIILEAIGGLLAQSYGVVASRAEKKAVARRNEVGRQAGAAGSGAGEPAAAPEGHSAATLLGATRGVAFAPDIAKACLLAEEEETRCRSVKEFLGRPDHFARMLRYQFFIQAFSEARAPALIRAGPQWEASEWARVLRKGWRNYRLSDAYVATELIHGQKLVSQLGSGAYEPAAEWYAGTSKMRTFAMAARGGGAMHDMGFMEQQRYDYKLFTILTDQENGAQEVLHDKAAEGHILGAVTHSHLQSYPTLGALQSQESLAALECDALIAPDSTQIVEQGHASVKRGKTIREETYKEDVGLSSAWRVLGLERNMLSTSITAQVQRAASGAQAPAERAASGAQAPAAEFPPPRKTRKHSLWQAWCSLYGGWVTNEKKLRYLSDTENPEIRARCAAHAQALTANQTWGGKRRRSEDQRIRRERVKCKRVRKVWNRAAVLQNLRRHDMSAYHTGRRKRLDAWLETRMRKRDITANDMEDLQKYARTTAIPGC